jgi:hypothetical protein
MEGNSIRLFAILADEEFRQVGIAGVSRDALLDQLSIVLTLVAHVVFAFGRPLDASTR